MLKPNQFLQHPADFDNAMYFALPITVLQQGDVIEEPGQITRHTDHAVFIREGYYLKTSCEFKVN